MNPDQTRIVTLVVRYGLPVVILAFYLTSVRQFAYTPDATYAGAVVTRHLAEVGAIAAPAGHGTEYSPNPLWVFFGVAGYNSSIDLILFAKVFALFFSCALLILAYLVAVEILDDRLLAFCVAFTLAMQAWLLYLAPSGSAAPAASALMLGCVFFMLRNEYILAGFFAGLLSLMLWQGLILMVVVLLDLWLNAVQRTRAVRIGAVSLLLYSAVVGPWVLYAKRQGIPIVTALLPQPSVPDFDGFTAVVLIFFGLCAGLGFFVYREGEKRWAHLRVHATPFLLTAIFLAAALFGIREMLALAAPMLIIVGFRGIQRTFQSLRRENALYAVAFGVVALALLLNQIAFQVNVKPALSADEEYSAQREEIAVWVRSHVSDSLSIAADFPGQLGYRSGKAVFGLTGQGYPDPDFIVTSGEHVPGYTVVYVPPLGGEAVLVGKPLMVWKRH